MRDTLGDLFTRLTDAAMNRDIAGMRAVGWKFRQSEEGQSWLQAGRDYNEAQREATLTAQQAEQAAMQQAAPVRSGPVMSM